MPVPLPSFRRSAARALAAAWCVLTLVTPALAQAAMRTFESRAYTVHTNAPDDRARELARHMDIVFDSYDRFFASLRGRSQTRQDLYLYNTRQDYIAGLAAKGINASASGGMFFYGPRGEGLATWVDGRDEGNLLSTLQHEGFHQFARFKTHGNLPLWVNEGLAEYFGDAIVVGDKVRHGIVDERRLARLRKAMADGQTLPFGQLVDITSEQWHGHMLSGSPRGYLQYDQSWAVVHFLIHADQRYERAFSAYLQRLSAGRTHEHAFEDAFGTRDTTAMQRRFEPFIADLEPDAYGTALTRLRFLASGLATLAERGDPWPDDLPGLRDRLRAIGYEVTTESHGRRVSRSASDDDLFTYEDARGNTHEFELQTHENPALPPRLLATRLRPAASIDWTTDGDGLTPATRFDDRRR